MALLDANTKRACDMLDGVADGIVGDPRKCAVELLELDTLECQDGPAADCLTAGQIETARFIYTGITDDSGAVIVPGVYPGAELNGDFQLWATGPVPLPGRKRRLGRRLHPGDRRLGGDRRSARPDPRGAFPELHVPRRPSGPWRQDGQLERGDARSRRSTGRQEALHPSAVPLIPSTRSTTGPGT